MSDNINNMDLKQLRNEVQLLRDELAIMKRKYEDIIYNLDTDNFSSRFVKEQGDMRNAIEINAEGIKTEVTNRTEADEELSSSITQTAEEISTSVSKTITVQFESDDDPNDIETTDAQKGMLCKYNDTLYYYNDISETWEEYPYDGINSKFIQTAGGFKFTNDVKIDADLIVSGTLSADRINTDTLSCTKLYSAGHKDGYYLKMSSNVGDLGIYVYDTNDEFVDTPTIDRCVFGVLNSSVKNGVANLYIYGTNFMGYNKSEGATFPKEKWDFSSSTVVGLEDSGYATKDWVYDIIGSYLGSQI